MAAIASCVKGKTGAARHPKAGDVWPEDQRKLWLDTMTMGKRPPTEAASESLMQARECCLSDAFAAILNT